MAINKFFDAASAGAALAGTGAVEAITRRRRAAPERSDDGRAWVLRYTRFSRRLFAATAIFFGFCLVASTVAWIRNPTTRADLALRIVVFGSFFCLGVYCVTASRKRLLLSDEGLELRPFLGRPRRLPWSEIEHASFSTSNKSLKLVGRDGESIKIYLYTMDGIPKLHDYLKQRAGQLLDGSGIARNGAYIDLVS